MKISYNILYILLVFALTACSDQDLNDFIADNILYHLNTSAEDVSADPIDQSHIISVNTNTDWTAETEASWIVIDNAVGDSKTELSFKTLANDTPTERVGKIGIYCFGKHKKDITIRQRKVTLGTNQEGLEFNSSSSEQSISINTEGRWSISSSAEWIKLSSTDGFGSSTITVVVDELMSVKNRQATITITDQSFQKKDISVSQKGKYLSTGISKLSFLASGENVENISFETDGIVEFACDSWINITKTSDNSANIKAAENTSGKTKNGSIYLLLKGVSDCEPVAIALHQAPVKTSAEAVDLGLSVKWASYNIGAKNENEIGGHYHYGEGPDFTYDWYNIPNELLPECVTGTMYDTSHSYWGGHWRNPTKKEWQELYTNCTMELIDLPFSQTIDLYNEFTDYHLLLPLTKAYKFTAPNGNYIIIPEAGTWYYYDGPGQINYEGIYAWYDCGYHTSTKSDQMVIHSQEEGMSWHYGMGPNWFISVRAVWDN